MINDKDTYVLQFSGGKDSIACLLYLKEYLDKIIVVWADSGDSFPETKSQMEIVKSICPNFVVAKGNQPEVIGQYGYPVDVLPVNNHSDVQYLAQQDRPKMQAYLQCCSRSFFGVMEKTTKELGATVVIRGQKLADKHKSPIKNGDVVDGVTYWFPLENWTDEQVLEYVKESSLLPAHYDNARTSLDCMHCTAYISDNKWKLPYLEKYHPEQGKEVRRRFNIIRSEIEKDMQSLYEVTNG